MIRKLTTWLLLSLASFGADVTLHEGDWSSVADGVFYLPVQWSSAAGGMFYATSAVATSAPPVSDYTANIVQWWKASDLTATNGQQITAWSSATNGATLYATNSATWTPVYDTLGSVPAVYFTNVANRMQTDAAIDIPTSSTIMAWAWIQKLYTGPDAGWGADLTGWSQFGFAPYLVIHIQNNGYVQHFISNAERNYRVWNSDSALSEGEWVHIAVASTSTNPPNVYINGSYVSSAKWTEGGIAERPTSLMFGLSRLLTDTGDRMNMWIGEVRVYAEEVASNNVVTAYEAGAGTYQP